MIDNTLRSLVDTWNYFLSEHQNATKDEIDDFRRNIHNCQRILAMREVKKNKESPFYEKNK